MRPESLIGPLIGALGTIGAAWIAHRYRQQVTTRPDEESEPQPGLWVPTTVVKVTPPKGRFRRLRMRLRRLRAGVRAIPRAVPSWGIGLWKLMNRLPPAQRRTRPVVAAALGWFPFGQAAYFRTTADFLVGVVLIIPFGIAASGLPDTEAEEAGATTPIWAGAMLWTVVVLGALYAYLRALSSNRAIELSRVARRAVSDAPPEGVTEPRTPDARRFALEGRLSELARTGWSTTERGEFDAVVVRRPETDHRRKGILTLVTLGLWGWVWIYRALLRGEEREVEVDRWGTVRVAVPGSRDTSSVPTRSRRSPGLCASRRTSAA